MRARLLKLMKILLIICVLVGSLSSSANNLPPSLLCRARFSALDTAYLSKPISFIKSPHFANWKNIPAWDRRYEHSELYFELKFTVGELEISKYHLLSRAEERYLFLKMNFLKSRAEANRQSWLKNRNEQVVSLIQSDLAEANQIMDAIYDANTSLVIFFAKKYVGRHLSIEEAFNEAYPWVLRSIRAFDAGLENRFGTYLRVGIHHCLSSFLKERQDEVQILSNGEADGGGKSDFWSSVASPSYGFSVETNEAILQLSDIEQVLIHSYFGGDRPLSELASELNIGLAQATHALDQAIIQLRRYLDPSAQAPDTDLMDKPKGSSRLFVWNYQRDPRYREIFENLISEDERTMLKLRFDLAGANPPVMLEDVGKELKLSKQTASNRINRAVEDMNLTLSILSQIDDVDLVRPEATSLSRRVQAYVIREMLSAKNRVKLGEGGLRPDEIKLLEDYFIDGRDFSEIGETEERSVNFLARNLKRIFNKLEKIFQVSLGKCPTRDRREAEAVYQ